MTIFKTLINGLPYEIRIDEGLHLEIDTDGMTVMRDERRRYIERRPYIVRQPVPSNVVPIDHMDV